MKAEDFLSSIAEIDDSLLADVALEESVRKKSRVGVLFAAVAVCAIAAAFAVFAVALGMRRPVPSPTVPGTEESFVSPADETVPESSGTETEPSESQVEETETDGETDRDSATESADHPETGPDEESRYGKSDHSYAPATPDTGKDSGHEMTPDSRSDGTVTTDKTGETGGKGDDPAPPDTETDRESETERPPVDPDAEMTVEDLCHKIYCGVENSPALGFQADLPMEANGTTEGGSQGGQTGTGGHHSSVFKENEFGSVWYYYNVVCGGYGTSTEMLKIIAEGYENTALTKGRASKMLVDYVRFRVVFDNFFDYFPKREYPGFSDVGDGTEYKNEIIEAYELGLMDPKDDDVFGVSEHVTQGELDASIEYIIDNFSYAFRH